MLAKSMTVIFPAPRRLQKEDSRKGFRSGVDEHFAMRRPGDIPFILLARLAVDERATGQGIGMATLQDALRSNSVNNLLHCLQIPHFSTCKHLISSSAESSVEALRIPQQSHRATQTCI